MNNKIIVVALGGNALIREGQRGTIAEQFENVQKSLDGIIYCLKARISGGYHAWKRAPGGKYAPYG